MPVTLFDIKSDGYITLSDGEVTQRIEDLERMAVRYYKLRCALVLAINSKKRLPNEVKALFKAQQAQIDAERGYTAEALKRRRNVMSIQGTELLNG